MENTTYFSATFSIALLLLRMLSSTLSILTYCNAYAILIISKATSLLDTILHDQVWDYCDSHAQHQ